MKIILMCLLAISSSIALANPIELNCNPLELINKDSEKIRIDLKRTDLNSPLTKGDEIVAFSSFNNPRWREINGRSVYVVNYILMDTLRVNGEFKESVYAVKLKLDSLLTTSLRLKSKYATTTCRQVTL